MEEIIKKFQGIGFELDSVKICGATMIRNNEKVYLTEVFADYEKAEGDVPFYYGTDFFVAEKDTTQESSLKSSQTTNKFQQKKIPF